MQGLTILRQRLAEKVTALYGAHYNPETEITVTSGATEALFAAITAVVQPGDEVVVFEPAYDAYVPVIQLCGGTPLYFKMKFPHYRVDWDELRDTITDKTKLIIVNTPHNPTGTVLSNEDIAALIQIVENTNLFILSDEVYEHIVFDGLSHQSLARYPELVQRSFIISSFGKTYHSTGWKIGYCLAPELLTREFQRIHQFLTFASNTPIQYAYAEFMQRQDIYSNLSSFYQKKRDRFQSLIEESRFQALPCKGTYFQIVDYSAISNDPDVGFAKQLTIEKGVASIPPSVFYRHGDDHRVLRFCFAKKDETIEKAAEILCRI
jgi:methionine aminotransferase